jgi:hypothetical protein
MPRSNRTAVSDAPAKRLLDLVVALRACANKYGSEPAARKASLLRDCAACAVIDAPTLLAYHDCLLFLLAYPESARLHAAARRELVRVAAAARSMINAGPARARRQLTNSGIAWAPMTIAFGYDIARWLVASHPNNGAIDSFDEAGVSLPGILRHAFPSMEFELLAADDTDSGAFLALASAGYRGTTLAWLVGQFANLPCAEGLREQLFDSLKAFITINPAATSLSRTFVRGLAARTFFHRGDLKRVVDPLALLAQPLEPATALTRAQRMQLLDAGRAMLASLGRETDAISAATPEGIEYHALGRGVAIALYTMAPGRRLPLDSHVGFMLFKNSIPVGYGGGWPFLGSAKIGVNIFAPFRGGESAYLFCQVLRVYSQRFGVTHFVAEPSQFGGGNREGIESGAFWFYYRLGFRPVTPALAALAADEFDRMRRKPGYRPPFMVLRRFTRSDIELHLRPNLAAIPACDPADLSLAVSAWIARRHLGDRAQATTFAVHAVTRALRARGVGQWPGAEQRAFESLCLLLVQIPDLAHWSARDKARVIAVVRAKGGDEFRYFDLLRKTTRLHAALRQISARTV